MGIKNFASLSILILFFTLAQTATAQERHVAKYVPRPETEKSKEIVFSEDHLKLLKAELLKFSETDEELYAKAVTEMESLLKSGIKVMFVNEYKAIEAEITELQAANKNETKELAYQERNHIIQDLKAKNTSTYLIITNLKGSN